MNKSNLNITDEMALQANNDIAKRSITGSYIYLVIWFSIIIPHKFYERSPGVSLWMTVTLILLAALRIGLITNFNRIYQKSSKLWKILFFPIIWMPALVWGVFCALTFILPEFGYMSLAFMVGTAGLTGGGVSALIPSRILALGLLTSYLAPGGAVLIISQLSGFIDATQIERITY